MNSVLLDGRDVYPSKIVCIGKNYVAHIKELNDEIPEEPVIFIKPNSAIADKIHAQEELIHHEAEITFLIMNGKLHGVGFGLDLTKREVQAKLKARGLPWERSKAFDGSAVFSEFVTFKGNTADLGLELAINGKLAQKGGVSLMMNKPEALLDEVKKFFTLEDGDLLMTGTPKGVGPINAGDLFTGKIFDKDSLLVEASWLVS